MDIKTERQPAETDLRAEPTPESSLPMGAEESVSTEPSLAEQRARRMLIIGLIAAGLLLVGLIVLLVFLSIDAYQAAYTGAPPSPGVVVVGLLRDAAIVFVAFETLLVGVLLIVLMLQMQSLIMLLREEIKPMLESANETLATVRGTTQFVSHNVVSPVVKWSGYLAGVRRVVKEATGLFKDED